MFNDARDDRTDEHRIWEQATLTYRSNPDLGFLLQSRTRVEQRFSEAGSDIGHRVRQFVRFNWQPLQEFPLGLAMWDELFVGINRTDWGAPLEACDLLVYVDRDTDIYQRALAVNLFTSFRP